MDGAFQCAACPQSNQLLSTLWTATQGIPQITDNPCDTHCVLIGIESGLGCPLVIHHNLSIVCGIALGGEVPEMAKPGAPPGAHLELISLW